MGYVALFITIVILLAAYAVWVKLARRAHITNFRFPDALRQYWRDPLRHTPPNAEPLREFQRRIETAWDGLIQQQADTRHLLLVVHGGVIRVILCRVLGIPDYRFVVIDHPISSANDESLRAMAEATIAQGRTLLFR